MVRSNRTVAGAVAFDFFGAGIGFPFWLCVRPHGDRWRLVYALSFLLATAFYGLTVFFSVQLRHDPPAEARARPIEGRGR